MVMLCARDEKMIRRKLTDFFRRGRDGGSFQFFISLYVAVMYFYDLGLVSDGLCIYADRLFFQVAQRPPYGPGPCRGCPCWHPDAEACMMSPSDRFHACPLYDDDGSLV